MKLRVRPLDDQAMVPQAHHDVELGSERPVLRRLDLSCASGFAQATVEIEVEPDISLMAIDSEGRSRAVVLRPDGSGPASLARNLEALIDGERVDASRIVLEFRLGQPARLISPPPARRTEP